MPYREAPEPEGVTPAHLGQLPEIHELLFALDDPHAALPRVVALSAKLRPLASRVIALARERAPRRDVTDLTSAVSVVGNRGLEMVLLGLLEDLTILKSDLEG